MIKRLNRRGIVSAALLLISSGADASNAGKITERLKEFIGRPVSEVFEKVEYPDRKETYGTDTVYYWGVDQPDGPSCTYKVAAGSDGLVKTASAYGNDWGCDPIAKRLKKP